VEASINTWAGLAADVFRVAAAPDTDWGVVRDAASAALARHGGRNGKPAPIDGRLEIDNAASPWHTIVEVRAADRGGLLHRVAEAMSRAGIQIHHATVRTVDGVAIDTFLVTGREGHKLDRRGERDLRLSFEGSLRGRWTPMRIFRRSAVTTGART
jgi:[protein-PII] uridylyltransferase